MRNFLPAFPTTLPDPTLHVHNHLPPKAAREVALTSEFLQGMGAWDDGDFAVTSGTFPDPSAGSFLWNVQVGVIYAVGSEDARAYQVTAEHTIGLPQQLRAEGVLDYSSSGR